MLLAQQLPNSTSTITVALDLHFDTCVCTLQRLERIVRRAALICSYNAAQAQSQILQVCTDLPMYSHEVCVLRLSCQFCVHTAETGAHC